MTMQNPLDFTQGDLAGLMDAGQTIANIPGTGGGSSPLGGLGDMLDTVQRVLDMAGQFTDRVDKFGTLIARYKGLEMPEPVPAIQPVKVYAKALGWLAQLPEDMTMKEALELARSNKGMILGAIEKELPDLLSADGPGE
jgi:hypothetical protein